MRQAFLIVVVALWSAPVRGQFSTPYVYYDGQNRSVSSHAESTGAVYMNDVTNEATITAPDFQAFNQNLVEMSSYPNLSSATAVATQNSLFGFKLSATGGANATAGSSHFTGGRGSASSSFQTTFSVLANTAEILSVQLSAHVDGVFDTVHSYANATFTLSGGSTNIVLATNILPGGQHDSVVTFPPTQLQLVGFGQLYTISVIASAYDIADGILDAFGTGPSTNASYSFSLTPVPEPSSIALLLIGSAVLIATGFRSNSSAR